MISSINRDPTLMGTVLCVVSHLLCAKAATALARLSHRNSVRHSGGSVKNGAR